MSTVVVTLGAALRRAWVGYRRRLDAELAAAGFADQRLPDGRVLRLCSAAPHVTTAQIGRELGITRQGASKVVGSLRTRGYVTLEPSPISGREKIVRPTARALDLLETQRKAVRRIESELRDEIGTDSFDSLQRLLDALGGDEQPRMRDYLRNATGLDDLGLDQDKCNLTVPRRAGLPE
jgi:DNA-binding MarR family transcriptional regulator